MGFNFQGAKVSGDLSSAFTQATVIHADSNGSSVTMGTVPAGKKWIIVTAAISCCSENANIVYGRCDLNADSQTLLTANIENMTGAVAANSISLTFPSDCRPVATAGSTVTVSSPSGATASASVTYIEETA